MDERGVWDGPSIIEKQNLIGAWRAQHSFLAHPQPPAMIRISRAYNFAGFWETPVQRCICWEVQYIQEQVQALSMHAPGQNVRRYICWLVVVCKMRLSAARSGSFENRQLYQWVAGISFSSILFGKQIVLVFYGLAFELKLRISNQKHISTNTILFW